MSRSNEIVPPLILWNGQMLGDITPFFVSCEKTLEGYSILSFHALNVRREPFICRAKAYKYENSIPLLIDELKPVFGISRVGRHAVQLKTFFLLLCRHDESETTLPEYSKMYPATLADPISLREIRKVFVFRLLMSLSRNIESSVWVRSSEYSGCTFISYRDVKVDHLSESNTYSLAQTVVTKWFGGDWGLIDSIVVDMLGGRTISEIRTEIMEIIRRVDKELVWWSSAITRKIQERT
jgi:hypothetical protein